MDRTPSNDEEQLDGEVIEIHKRWDHDKREFIDIDCYPQWISIKNRSPLNGDHLLLSDGIQIAIGWMNQSRKEFIQVGSWANLTDSVTHWMPLPGIPK